MIEQVKTSQLLRALVRLGMLVASVRVRSESRHVANTFRSAAQLHFDWSGTQIEQRSS